MADIRTHRRILDTFTAPYERPLLHWLAARMPAWATPDVLTGIGVIGGLFIFLGYWLSGVDRAFLWLASLGFVVNWFGDSLDGTVARFRHIERPVYGFYIDHAVDAYIVFLIFIGLGVSPYVRFDLACITLLGYMLLNVLVLLRTAAKGEFAISYGRLGPTELRMIAIAANTMVFLVGNPKLSVYGYRLSIYDWVAIIISILFYAISILTTLRQASILSDWDRKNRAGAPLPTRPHSPRRKNRELRQVAGRTASRRLSTGDQSSSQD